MDREAVPGLVVCAVMTGGGGGSPIHPEQAVVALEVDAADAQVVVLVGRDGGDRVVVGPRRAALRVRLVGGAQRAQLLGALQVVLLRAR